MGFAPRPMSQCPPRAWGALVRFGSRVGSSAGCPRHALTDVGVLQEAADPSLAFQLLVI